MPRFEVVGIGRETGRKRKRIYTAADKESAIMAASSEGTIVEVGKIRQLPEEPASERQIEYAKAYGIKVPENATKKQLCELLTKAEKENWPKGTIESATEKQKRFATELGLKIPQNLSKFEMSELLNNILKKRKFGRIAANLPPTEAQLAVFESEEINPPPGITRQRASEIIDQIFEEKFREISRKESI